MWESLGERLFQFRVLYRVFLLRVIDLELLSRGGDPTRLMGQFASLFTSVSYLLTLPTIFLLMSPGLPQLSTMWTIEHFFLETTMTVAGLVMVLSWDSAFPDRTDVLVLTPLPVRTRTLFLAKICALFVAPGLAMLAFNLPAGLVWPVIFGLGKGGLVGIVRAWLSYWMTGLMAGAFFVFAILTLQGVAANLLPRQVFLRLSALLQAAVLCLLLCGLFLEPSLSSPAALSAAENQRWLAWLPSYWFLGLFHQLDGSMHPALAPLARRAWMGLAVSSVGAAWTLMLSYFRTMPRIVEQPEILPVSRSLVPWPRSGSSLRSAITFFSLRTLLRSRQHRMILSFYLGVGLVIVFGYVRTPSTSVTGAKNGMSVAYLLTSIVMMALTVVALRVVASIPMSFRAHWIFRVTQVDAFPRYQGAVRFAWWALGVAPVVLVLSGGFWAYAWQQTLVHLAAMLLLGLCLVELCLFSFQKIPFTCSYLPGKGNLHFVFWVALIFVVRLLKEAALKEQEALSHLSGCVALLLILAAAAGAMRWVNRVREGLAGELKFEEEEPSNLIALKLT